MEPDLFAGQVGPADGSKLYKALTGALGYAGSPRFCEDAGDGIIAPSDRHWIRAAREAGARGTYFFRTSPSDNAFRPAVHVAEAQTPKDARAIHRRLWNQGINPFLIVVLPSEVRVLAGFAFHPQQLKVGKIDQLSVRGNAAALISKALATFSADSINRGDVWQSHAKHLGVDGRVDTTLLANLKALSGVLQKEHGVADTASHALIGKFVYLSYLRARDILSDEWLQAEAGLPPQAVFSGETFSAGLSLQDFRKLAKSVENRFNGHLFPIPWGSRHAPRAEAIRTVARAFAGDDALSGQIHLPFTAYDFSFIPVELLSAIYEQFLHAEGPEGSAGLKTAQKVEAADPEKQGAHYTPEPLADYLVAEVNSVRPLRSGMKILDPCCGSGIFLVVAFRRLVELESARLGRPLHTGDLKRVLEAGIFGVERNATACQIAGFSLILALLSYVEPPELHRHKSFKFPRLIGNNLFVQDFFDPAGAFWKKTGPAGRVPLGFDWIIGNPPWVELEAGDSKDRFVLDWSQEHRKDYGLARARTGEAFAWRVMDRLAEDGAVGLILHAKSLTNDHLTTWRKKFFGGLQVHRVTNFANLAYVLFASAQQPAATIVYSRRVKEPAPILHVGPFVANQPPLALRNRKKRRAWTISFSETEVKWIPAPKALEGGASTWKLALWGTPRDEAAIRRLRRIFSTELGRLADARGWSLSLGLQLRKDAGNPDDTNKYKDELKNLKVLDHKALIQAGPALRVNSDFLRNNQFGCFVRVRGGFSGLRLIEGHRLFLWNDFAAYSEDDFIIRHSKMALNLHNAKEAKAIAAIWNSRYVAYLLFFVLSSDWGVGYSLIDKGDAERLPFPELTAEREAGLAAAWDEAATLEADGIPFEDIKDHLDLRVAAFLGIPEHVSLVVRDFFRVRYALNKGKVPPDFLQKPSADEMRTYAFCLRNELDIFLGSAGRHRVSVLHSSQGVAVSITLTGSGSEIEPEIRSAAGGECRQLEALLQAAESRFSQWAYFKRSVRVFAGETIHLIKPPRRLEWTETQALLDADDIIAEVIEAQSSREA